MRYLRKHFYLGGHGSPQKGHLHMNTKLNATQIKENIEIKLSRYFGCTPQEASDEQMYKAVSMTVRDILTQKRGDFKKEVNKQGV